MRQKRYRYGLPPIWQHHPYLHYAKVEGERERERERERESGNEKKRERRTKWGQEDEMSSEGCMGLRKCPGFVPVDCVVLLDIVVGQVKVGAR